MKRIAIALAAGLGAPVAAHASPIGIPDYDFDWAVIGDPDNPAYDGRFGQFGGSSLAKGRGSVDYFYRVSKLEVTSAQWLEFLNTFSPQSDDLGELLKSSGQGFSEDIFWRLRGNPGRRYELRDNLFRPEDLPVDDVNWRQAAMYVNWLHNGKSSDPSALENGAYDISTFGVITDDAGKVIAITDQATRNPDAKFWIPSLDEWLKAAHYDPNRFGPGDGGWWRYQHMSDEPPVPGIPGEEGAQTSVGVSDVPEPWGATPGIPLGSYPNAASPWGLLDLSGGAREWTESWDEDFFLGDRLARFAGGNPWSGGPWDDIVRVSPMIRPDIFGEGLRVASAVPGPGAVSVFSFVMIGVCRRRRR